LFRFHTLHWRGYFRTAAAGLSSFPNAVKAEAVHAAECAAVLKVAVAGAALAEHSGELGRADGGGSKRALAAPAVVRASEENVIGREVTSQERERFEAWRAGCKTV
jgi:hypothetical protein